MNTARHCLFVGWCFEPSQPLGVTSGLNRNSNLSLSFSAHESFNTNHNSSTAQLFQTYTHTKSHIFLQNLKLSISQFFTNFASKYLILYKTYQSLSGSQKISQDSHFGTVSTKISPQNISFSPPLNQHTLSTYV